MCDPITVGTAGTPAVTQATVVGSTVFMSTVTPAVPATSGLFGSAGAFSLGTTLSTLGQGFGILSALSSSAQQSANMEYQAQMFEYNRKIGENNALAAEYAAAQEADLFDDRLKVILASQGPRYAKSGVVINQDTPLEIAVDTAAEGAAERLAILHGGVVAASAARTNAQGQQFAANNARLNAGAARTSGYLNAAAGGAKFFGSGPGRGLLT